MWDQAIKIFNPCFIIVLLTWYVLACSSASIEQAKAFPIGDYQYTGYDERGARVVEGRLSITSSEPVRIRSEQQVHIKGNWQFKKSGNQEKIGPQVGSGDLNGSVEKNEVYINLNPNVSDSNVILRGTIEDGRYHGKWSFNGYAGPISQGTFEATRK